MSGSAIEKLSDDATAVNWLIELGLEQPKRALTNLRQVSQFGLAAEAVETLLKRVEIKIPELSDADRALNNLERFVAQSSDVTTEILQRDDQAFEGLLRIFSTSQYLSDLLIRDPERFRNSWQSNLISQSNLIRIVCGEIDKATSTPEAMLVLRRFKHDNTLRIAIYDLIYSMRIEQVTTQISFVATAIVEAAYRWARKRLTASLGEPINSDGKACEFVVLAMGKLGGMELNYSSDIDLVMVYDQNGMTEGGDSSGAKSVSNQEFFGLLCREMVKLIGESSELGVAYRVDLRLRPNGASGRICSQFDSMVQYYDLQGRTWERQALIKALPIAGDLDLGERLLRKLSPWIYRRNLSRADITGIKALKRKIERRALAAGEDRTNVKTGHGGIRDVEFIIQFLQLLNGELAAVRTTNTLDAIRRLERAQCLSAAESAILAQNYEWLRKLEHRLQLMFDMQVHTIPSDDAELTKVAKRMGFKDQPELPALQRFKEVLAETTQSNRTVLNHLLHDAFGLAFGSLHDTQGRQHRYDQDEVPMEVDLILDPDPDPLMIKEVLQPYGFTDVQRALSNLMELASENTQFLSSRRCKHFLASVAPALLSELSKTPDPDVSLVKLGTVSDCLGAKGVLWELFSFNPPTLSLYVRLCASSDYLVGILKSNPGMIDELVDALQMDRLPTRDWLGENMREMSKGAVDLLPILHSFKNTQHMRVGVRDILGRDDVVDTHLTLSEVAEACLATATRFQTKRLLEKHAKPEQLGRLQEIENPLVILGLGKFGGQEPNYHSDLDIVFLYNSNPQLVVEFESCLKDGITCQFFFSELAAAITRFFGHSDQYGRLYEIDGRLRPTGKSGSLAVSFDEFNRYFESGQGQLWERLALCKARPVFGMQSSSEALMKLVRKAITELSWEDGWAAEIRAMRMAMQKDCSDANLKRGAGGTVDVEFIVQALQLRHAVDDQSVLVTGTREAIACFKSLGWLEATTADRLTQGYQLLRSVEARLRLMNTTARHDLPDDPKQLAKLAYLLNYQDAAKLADTVGDQRKTIREIFDQILPETAG